MTLDFNRYHRILDQINPIKVNGTVNEIIGLMVEGHGPASSVGEMCNIFANGGACEKLRAEVAVFQDLYPEIFRCVACNTCTKACPQDLEVMDYIQAAKRGDIEKVMDLSFDCLSCGLCAIRCPAEIVHYNVGILGRRLYGRYLAKESHHLDKRIREVTDKKFDAEYRSLMAMKKDELKKKYYARDIE